MLYKTIGLYVNTDKDTNMTIAAQIASLLRQYGFNVRMIGSCGLAPCDALDDFLKDCDAVFVLGGDGTLLMIAKKAALYQKPVLGINLGRLGFLSEVEVTEAEEAIALIAQGKSDIRERMMLSCHLDGEEFFALNEVALHRCMSEHMMNIEARAGAQMVDRFYADGVLVASPTGSTAYNLSAGGPIVAPNACVMLLTPISAHTLRARPYVFSDTEQLSIQAAKSNRGMVAIDGVEIHEGDNICFSVSRAQYTARFLTVTNKNFYAMLNLKLNEWSIVDE